MTPKLVRPLVTAVIVAAALLPFGLPAPAPASADACQRSVWIDPMMTVPESAGLLNLTVHTSGCAAAGSVAYAASSGTAAAGVDFELPDGILQWQPGDLGARTVTAAVVDDGQPGAALAEFTVTLLAPSPSIQVIGSIAQPRILDDDIERPVIAIDDQWCIHPPVVVPPMPNAAANPAANPGANPMPNPAVNPAPTPSPTLNPTPDSPAICGAEPGHIIEPFMAHLVRAGLDPGAVTVRIDTVDGTAVAGVAYTPVHDLIVFPPGAVSVDVPIDLLPGAAGYFFVEISEPSVGIVVSPVAQMTLGPQVG